MNLDNQDANSVMPKKNTGSSSKSEIQINATTRLQRNQAEKQRRDRLNGYVTELATLVPMVKNASKPLDKVSILRLTAAHMRLNLSCLNPKKFKGDIPQLPNSFISQLESVEKSLGGFIIASTFAGQVVFCSKSIENFTGYHDIDIIGQQIFNYVHDKEVSFFERKVNSLVSQYKKKNNKKISKTIKMHMRQRPLPRTNDTKYQKMTFKLTIHCNDTSCAKEKDNKINDKRKKIGCKDFGSSAIVLMFVQPSVEPNINLLLVSQDVYYTVHGLQGEIMFADQRISTITGYLAHEVKGTNAYHYIFEPDVPIALFAQKAMFSSNDGIGLITYRLKIFGSQFIYLQSKGRIVHKDSSTDVSHFVCYNRCLSDEEGSKELKKFQERFAPQIDKAENKDGEENIEATKSHPASPRSSVSSNINDLTPNNYPLNSVQLSNNNSCHEEVTRVKMKGYSSVSSDENISNRSHYSSYGFYTEHKGVNGNVESSSQSVLSNYPKGATPVEYASTNTIVMESSQETGLSLQSSLSKCERTADNLNDVSPTFPSKNEDVFSQDSATFNDLNLNDLVFKSNSSLNSSFNYQSLEKDKGPTMGLVNPEMQNDECNFFSNRLPSIPNSTQDRYIVQQMQLSNNLDASFAYGNVSESFNKLFQESFSSEVNKCSPVGESSATDKSCYKSRCDAEMLDTSVGLDNKAVCKSNSARYPHFNEYLNDKMDTSSFEFDASILIQPCSQNNAYLNQLTDFSLRDNYLNRSYSESNPLDMYSDCNSVNGSSSKFWCETQDLQSMLKPAQPNRHMYPEQMHTECTPVEPRLSTSPSERKTAVKGPKSFAGKAKCNDSKLVQKLYESHFKIGNALDFLSHEQRLDSDVRYLNQCQTEQPFVKNSSHSDNGIVNLNSELFNELDVCFAKLPSSVCSRNSSDISNPQNWNFTDHENAPIFTSDAIINGFSDQMDLTILR